MYKMTFSNWLEQIEFWEMISQELNAIEASPNFYGAIYRKANFSPVQPSVCELITSVFYQDYTLLTIATIQS